MADSEKQTGKRSDGDAAPRTAERAGGRGTAAEAELERGVSRMMETLIEPVIERTVAQQQRPAVRQGLAEVMRDALNALVETESRRQFATASIVPAAGPVAQAFTADAVAAGVGALKQVQNLGFVEFTTGLINGTFDAIIAATIKQMDAYAKLVADLAKTLAQFQAENVSNAQINAHLSGRYPDGKGGTSVRSDFTFAPEVGGNTKFQEVVEGLIAETVVIREEANRLTRARLGIQDSDQTIVKFTPDHVVMIRDAMGQVLATNMMEHLRAMAREGMARIVITDGQLLSKLTFNVSATDQQSEQKSQLHNDSFNVGVKGQAGWGWGSIGISAGYNQMNVNTVDQSSFDSTTMSAEIIGQVRINFKTESFPPITTTA